MEAEEVTSKRKHEDEDEDPDKKRLKEEKDNFQKKLKVTKYAKFKNKTFKKIIFAHLKKQNELFWNFKDKIMKEMSNEDVKYLLELNEQKVIHGGIDDTSTQLADILCFGALENCSECKNGQLQYSSKYYYCTGNITEWTKCSNRTQEPKRRECIINEEYADGYEFLKKYKFEERTRVFERTIEEIEAYKKIKETKEETVEVIKNPKKPFTNMKFAVAGKLKYSNAKIKEIIEDLGGKLSSSVDNSSIIVVISKKEEVEKESNRILTAKSNLIPVVSEEFIDECKDDKLTAQFIDEDKFVESIKKHTLETWGTEIKTRLKNIGVKKEKKTEEERYSKSAGTVKMKLKGGLAVDPDSGLEDEAHVLRESDSSKDPFSVVLSMVDITRGKNSFYKLQLLENDKSSRWYIFRAWGRVGTSIGGNRLDEHHSKSNAQEAFYNFYYDKTGNEWSNRNSFTKIPGKFFPIEVDYGEGDDETKKSKSSAITRICTSKLEKPVQDVIRLIFDVEKMKIAMMEFEIDLNKMPLGKLSSNQLKKAFGILNELIGILDKGSSANKNLIVDASNRFYTLVPHNFGMKAPTMLDNIEMIKAKTDMLNNLLDIEIAYSMSKNDDSIDEDPIDQHYKKLKCEIQPLDKESDEYARLLQYIKNTHAATHSCYDLEVEDIFKVVREGERERFEPFSKLHNRKLLWHGSRVTNFAGILSTGLRIAPPEAPVSG
jgi:poly [ADP-ribose] polymerase 1